MKKIIVLCVFAACAALAGETPTTNLFESTPWVLLTGSHEVGFNWMTTQPANSWLEYRQDTNSEWKVSFYSKYGLKDGDTLYHKAYVKDYDPKKPIWYRFVGTEVIKFKFFTAKYHPEVRSEEGMIKPVVREDGSWTAAVFQDVHAQNDMYEPLLKLAGEDVTLVVSNGDPCHYFNSEEDIVKLLGIPLSFFAKKGIMATFVRGNHETRGSHARYLPNYITLRNDQYYGTADLGFARVLFLDSGDDRADFNKQYGGSIDFDPYMLEEGEWLRKEVASEEYKKAPWKVVIMHIPPQTGEDTWERAKPHFEDQVPTLVKAEPDIVLCGHDHRYQYYNKEDAKKLGFSFPYVVGDTKPLERATVERLDVKENELALTVFRGDGTTVTNETWRK